MSESVNGKPSWKSQSTAIWYIPDFELWTIGDLNNIGKPSGKFCTTGMLFGSNENGKWNSFIEKTWKKLDLNDFNIDCIAKKGTNQQYLIQEKDKSV